MSKKIYIFGTLFAWLAACGAQVGNEGSVANENPLAKNSIGASPAHRGGDQKLKKIQAFIDVANTCRHLSEEWDGIKPKKELDELTQSINRHCGQAKIQRNALALQYKKDLKVKDILEHYKDIDDFEF